MTAKLKIAPAEHLLGKCRVLTTTTAAALLATAAHQERTQLDEELYLEVFGSPAPATPKQS